MTSFPVLDDLDYPFKFRVTLNSMYFSIVSTLLAYFLAYFYYCKFMVTLFFLEWIYKGPNE